MLFINLFQPDRFFHIYLSPINSTSKMFGWWGRQRVMYNGGVEHTQYESCVYVYNVHSNHN